MVGEMPIASNNYQNPTVNKSESKYLNCYCLKLISIYVSYTLCFFATVVDIQGGFVKNAKTR